MVSRLTSTRAKHAGKREIEEVYAPEVTKDMPPFTLEEVVEDRRYQRCNVQVCIHTVMNWGARHGNEDRYAAVEDSYGKGIPFHILGVMDGHDSEAASDKVSRMLPPMLARRLQEKEPVHEACVRVMEELEEALKKTVASAGTCVNCCCIIGRYIWCSNLGDCRAAAVQLQALEDDGRRGSKVLGLHWLSKDHKAGTVEERKRIQEAGGMVIDGRVEGLEPSRTLGDFDVKMQVKKNVISIVPEVRRYELGDCTSAAQAIVVLASDGVWDVISAQDLVDLIHARKDLGKLQAAVATSGQATASEQRCLKDLAEDLVQFAIARGSRDDCTAVVALHAVSFPPGRR